MRFSFTDKTDNHVLFQGTLECQQCEFMKPDGTQCKRRTCKALPYCYQHTEKALGVKIADSLIPHAGKGLFATKEFRGSINQKKWIAPVDGEHLTRPQIDARYTPLATAPYTVENGAINYDGALKRYVGHYSNSLFGAANRSKLTGTNAVIGLHNQVPWLKAQVGKTIQPGREILTYYGNKYKLENHLFSSRTR